MKSLLSLVSVVSVLLSPFCASAATIHVPADEPTIQAAIDEATHGDLVLVDPGTYVENIVFKGKRITVRSTQGADVTVIDGNGTGSVVMFVFGETPKSVLEGFTVTNGCNENGAGIFCALSFPTITNCKIIHNGALRGGGIFCTASSPVIRNCIIAGNSAWDGGGGISIGMFSTP
ncbi:right-handed parallel beta-helix repeat-containing protein, partial [Thermodesulfobacteriota bacterium]